MKRFTDNICPGCGKRERFTRAWTRRGARALFFAWKLADALTLGQFSVEFVPVAHATCERCSAEGRYVER